MEDEGESGGRNVGCIGTSARHYGVVMDFMGVFSRCFPSYLGLGRCINKQMSDNYCCYRGFLSLHLR